RLLCDARLDVPGRTVWINRGSGEALRMLLEGCVHDAGLHYGLDDGDENLRVVRQVDPQGKLFIMRFSSWEQGWILGPGVPDAFTGIADLAAGTLRLANRESGAAVRRWLDTELIKTGTLPDSICGYASVHHSHFEAVDSINAGRADVMLGPRSIATVFKLRFIPIGRVAFDLVFDRSLLGNARLDASIKWLAGRQFQQQMASLPGYLLR
ncbi:MAG TPA: substrate-binding domain-containing protein, partial [Candidatus Ozemobacteraceae bacterium]|nr:substrate-binding domain-containing protein [Candidatus Ozemobacteraceae bacterium]